MDTDNCTCDCGGNCESEFIGVALYSMYIMQLLLFLITNVF